MNAKRAESRGEPARRTSRLEHPGIPRRYERLFDAGLVVIAVVFVAGWTFSIRRAARTGEPAPRIGAGVAINPLSPSAPPATAYLLDAAVRRFGEPLRGVSGDVRVVIVNGDSLVAPDSLPPDVGIGFRELDADTGAAANGSVRTAPDRPGLWNVLLQMRGAIRTVPDLTVIRTVPLSEKTGGRIGGYLIGEWPFERGGNPPSAAYAPPPGLVRVTPENQDVFVSTHFQLRDFLTKGQESVWPKYVALSPRLLDKLELTIDELAATGHPVDNVGVISGFRTPQYNRAGGESRGRGALSRHMYGDAMDVFIDNDRDGRMDDLNRDGRIDIEDGWVIVKAAERVEARYPHLVGGIGLYHPTRAHSGFVHIDTRGYRARW